MDFSGEEVAKGKVNLGGGFQDQPREVRLRLFIKSRVDVLKVEQNPCCQEQGPVLRSSVNVKWGEYFRLFEHIGEALRPLAAEFVKLTL